MLSNLCGTSRVQMDTPTKAIGGGGGRKGGGGASSKPAAAKSVAAKSVAQSGPARVSTASSGDAAAAAPGQQVAQGCRKRKAHDDGPDFDAEMYCRSDGKDKLDQDLVDLLKDLAGPDMSSFSIDEATEKKFQAALRGTVAKATKLHKDTITLQWKLKKRVSTPESCLQVVSSFRHKVMSLTTFMQQFQGRDVVVGVDVDKCEELMQNLKENSIPTPARCFFYYYKAKATDCVQFARFSALMDQLDSAALHSHGVPLSDMREVNGRILEDSLSVLLSNMRFTEKGDVEEDLWGTMLLEISRTWKGLITLMV
jgi:hypothetical protein